MSLLALTVFFFAGCVKDYPEQPFLALATPTETFTITVQVSGSSGSFTISDGADSFTIPGDGSHTLDKEYPSGSAFSLSVASPPTNQQCNISGGTGVLTASVSNVFINCVNLGVINIGQNRTYISQNPGAFNTVTVTFEPTYNGSFRIRSGADCTSGTDYPDASFPVGMTAGTPVNIVLNATTGGSPLAPGTNTYLICAYDGASVLQDEIPRTVEVDSTAPAISESPGAGNLNSVSNVTLTCNDPASGCNAMAYAIQSVGAPAPAPNPVDPTINADGSGATPALYSGPIALADQQVITIEAIATDNAGNRSAVASFTYTVDATLNSLSGASASEPFVSNVGTKTSTTITWTSDRSNRPYTIRINSTSCTDGTVINSGTTGALGHTTPAINATAFTPGTDQAYTVRICEENFIGEAGLGTTLTVTRDETAPVITPVTGNNSYVPHNSTIVYSFSEAVDTGATVIAGGDLSAEDNGGTYNGAMTQLTIAPAIGAHAAGMSIWAPGLSRALDLTVYDRAGNSASVSNTYVMRDGTVEPFYSNAADWNYYVKNDGTNVTDATNTACDGSENAFYTGCLHGGAIRKVMVLDKIDDCTGLTASDTNSNFNWSCHDPAGAGPVEMVSTRMLPGNSLTTLIDFGATAFRTNQVNLAGSAVPNAPAAVWWGNPIQLIPAAGGSAATAGAIYITPLDLGLSNTFSLDADNVSVATAPTAKVFTVGADPMIQNTGKSYSWIEGNYDGQLAVTTNGIEFTGFSQYHRFEKVNVWNVDGSSVRGGIYLREISDSYFNQVRVANTQSGNGLVIYDGSSNTNRLIFNRFTTYNNMANGLKFIATGTVSDLIFMNSFFTANDGDGIGFQGSGGLTNSVFMNLSIVNNKEDSIDFAFSGDIDSNTLVNIIGYNSGGNGLILNPGSADFQIIDAAFGFNLTSQIDMNNAANGHYFSGLLQIQGLTKCINVVPGTGLQNTPDCDPEGPSDHTPQVGVSSFGAGAGLILRMVASDPTNPSGLNEGYSAALTMDWTTFQFPSRAWGLENPPPPPSNVQGRCFDDAANQCRQYDFALFNAAHPLYQAHGCPAAAVSTDVIVHNWATAVPNSVTFVRHAQETDTDDIADLPFCMGNETCFFQPNIGGYQGHGPPGPSGCPAIGAGGLVENINFQEFANNGF